MAPDFDVLVVGGGPTGVTLAILAAQAGARTLVCEREADVYPLPRAAHADHEVMRVFQQCGAADEIMATSRQTTHYDFLNPAGEILLRFEGSDRIGPGGWPAANMIHQPSLERALRRRLAATAGAELRSGWTFTGLREDADRIVGIFDTPQGPRELSARYLVGADGTRSPVRAAAGVDLDDLGFDENWLVIDVLVHDAARLPAINLQICDPARPTTCVLMGEGRHRWEFMALPGESPQDLLDDGKIAELLAPWNVEGAVTLERKAVYRFNARVARQWRKGRVLLAGDAAHQTPPFAGQGMCAGIRDAANLGWKLGMIARSQAPDTILDSYQPEREPNARGTIQMAIMMGRTVCIADPAAAAERDRQMLAARASGQSPDGEISYPPMSEGLILAGSAGAGSYFPQVLSGARRLDEVIGNRAVVLCRGEETVKGGVPVLALDSAALAPFASQLGRWLDRHDADAVLIRPDRYVFGTGKVAELAEAWAAIA